MESWVKVWRDGFAPLFAADALEALAAGLRDDAPGIIQGQTTRPLPLPNYAPFELEGGDVLVYALWKSGAVSNVGEAEEAFARLCFEADARLGGPAESRHFLNWIDEAPRAALRAELLKEVNRELARRAAPVS